jgi:hypothetical protein
MDRSAPPADKLARWIGVRFVLMISILSFFANLTYEGREVGKPGKPV